MLDTLELILIICGIFSCAHALFCGLVSLIALVIAERRWRLRLKYRRIFFSMFLPGIALLIIYALLASGTGANDDQELIFWSIYTVLTVSGLAYGLQQAKKKAQGHAA